MMKSILIPTEIVSYLVDLPRGGNGTREPFWMQSVGWDSVG